MPTVLRIDGFRFFFYSNEMMEPEHIHVEHQQATAKYWLAPVRLGYSKGFLASAITKMFAIVRFNEQLFLDKWNEYFNK